MEKYKNKYLIQSHRKPNWDYSANALYFLTIVTQNRECNLGKILNNEMILSDFGKIVESEWLKSFEIRTELFLHDYIIMPNHLHTIVEIYNEQSVETHGRASNYDTNNNVSQQIGNNIDTHGHASLQNGNNIETHGRVSLQIQPSESQITNIKRNPPIRLPKSISSFIAGFKSAVNSKIDDYIDEHNLTIPKYNRKNHFFQPNYHDHIIRNNLEYQIIQNYIINNPMNWENDKFFNDKL